MAAPTVTAYTISTGTPIQNVPPNAATQGETMVPYPSLLQTGVAELAAGLATVGFGGDLAPIVIGNNSVFWFQVFVPGPANGSAYIQGAVQTGPLDPAGVPTGFLKIKAVDLTGATVVTDTSAVRWFVMG